MTEPIVGITAAFPVPTPSNPTAVFVKQKLVEPSPESSLLPESSSLCDASRNVRNELSLGRNDNRAKVAEDFRRREDLEAMRRKWKTAEGAAFKEDRVKEMEMLGLPESCAYLLETAQHAMKQYRDAEPKSTSIETGDADAKTYERAVKRLVDDQVQGTSGIERLRKDLDTRAERNAKRARSEKDIDNGVNVDNAHYNKQLERTMGKDSRTQMIRQNLERGTAL